MKTTHSLRRIVFGSSLLALALVLVGSTAKVSAGTITLIGGTDDKGTGFGDVLSVLSLSDNDAKNGNHDGSEWGTVSVGPTGLDVLTGETATGGGDPATQTWSVATLLANGINANNLSVIYDMNQTGGTGENLREFHVIGYSNTGTVLFDAVFSPTNTTVGDFFALRNNGNGQPDYAFSVSDPNLATVFATGTNRLGMSVFSNQQINSTANDGADSFNFAQNLNPVPEPATITMILSALVPLGVVGLRRLRRRSEPVSA